jgi:anti-sigma factor RsiW
MCDQRERLMDYLYDEASPADRRLVESHVESCDDCRKEIRAFRRVREDLLAWEVPEHQSVWTPFAPAPVPAWYRQVPAWGMAAAAGLMFILGTAGGTVAAKFWATDAPVQIAVANPAVPSVPVDQPARVTPTAMAEMMRPVGLSDDEVLAMVRREMSRVAMPDSVTASEAEALVVQTAQAQWNRIYDYLTLEAQERARERRDTETQLGGLQRQISDLYSAINVLQERQAGSGSKGQQ